jgi:hypothetical protein
MLKPQTLTKQEEAKDLAAVQQGNPETGSWGPEILVG